MVLAAFGFHQHRRGARGCDALIEAGLFRGRGLPAALAAAVLFLAVVNGLTTVVVLQLQLGPHTDVLSTGLTLLPWSCAMAVSSWIAGTRLVPRYGSRVRCAGLTALLLGTLAALVAYGSGPATSYPWPLLAALAVFGSGQGLFAVPFFTTALHRVRSHETGSAAGLLNAAQQLGGTLGTALLGTIFLHTAADGPSEPARAALNGARHAFWVSVGLIAATGVAAALLHAASRSNRGRRTEEGD
ncbi:MFS transporter [Streptomyces decoyicus]|uniref:MFS transporter n=1 Tax=Streptomyces decoyicus TaxID=249567 RepID=UPI0006938AA7|nr:MFS transporter [Streptomyces decoyicus]QZY17301.1 MFS transporter [Streptomyces decoyicus]